MSKLNTSLMALLLVGTAFSRTPTGQIIGKPESSLPDIEQKKGVDQPGLDLAALTTVSADRISKGKTVFAAKCAACHGADGKGMAALGSRNFHEVSGWKKGTNYSNIFETVTEGVPGTAMPSFGTLSPEDRGNVVHFVRSLNVAYPAVTAADAQNIDTKYGLGQTIKENHIVPIKVASANIVSENEASIKTIDDAFAKAQKEGGIVAASLTSAKALQILARSEAWKSSVTSLVSLVSQDLVNNGFSSSVKDLSAAQWSELQTALKALF